MVIKMVKGGNEYDLYISARRLINGGATSESMSEAETEALLKTLEAEHVVIREAVDYAAEQREYEASYESDEELRADMYKSAKRWLELSDRLSDLKLSERKMAETEVLTESVLGCLTRLGAGKPTA